MLRIILYSTHRVFHISIQKMRRYNEEDERAPSLPHLCPSTNRPMNTQDDDIFKEDQYTSQWENKTRICHGVTAEVSRKRRNFNPAQSWRKYNCFIRQCHDRLKWYRRLAGTSVFVCPASTEQQHHHHHSDDRQQEGKTLLQYQGNDATDEGNITMLWGNSTADPIISRAHLLTIH